MGTFHQGLRLEDISSARIRQQRPALITTNPATLIEVMELSNLDADDVGPARRRSGT